VRPSIASHIQLSQTLEGLAAPLSTFLTVGILCIGAVHLEARLRSYDTSWVDPPANQNQEVDPRLIKIASLGQVPAWIDSVLIKSFADPAYDPVLPGTHPPLYYELKLVTALDPDFEEVYRYGASILSVVRRDGPGTADLLGRAHQRILQGGFQNSAYLLETIRGYNALFELRDIEQATEAFDSAAKLPRAPAYLQGLAARLKTTQGRFKVALLSLDLLLLRQNDPETQRVLELRKDRLQKAKLLFEVNHSLLKWLKGRKPSAQNFERFKGSSYQELRWDSARNQVESTEAREVEPGFY